MSSIGGITKIFTFLGHVLPLGQNEVVKTDKFDWSIRTNAKGELCIKSKKTVAT